ncbi:ATP-binding cassette domain-containing protein [Symbioplanes lichenis]|uniref:ATP-binding cassette domain-containing protein n=1 Tax=Symbioplanes lichenis TaxID=1629072 RepID=UPI002738364E|nr:ABC transporter ATP-binding protein [Actinoplanes lichenis]
MLAPVTVRLRQVSKRYGRGRWILSGVDLTLPAAEIVHVAGGNGAGKSTLLRVAAGASRPTRGTVSGIPPVTGYVPDRFTSTDAMSSAAYLTHVGRIRGLGGRASTRRAHELLDRLALAGGPHTPIRALSKGNAQKVALAQALMAPPALLVLDEPWSGLDTAAHAELAAILREVRDTGAAVLLTDHRSGTHGLATISYALVDGALHRRAAVSSPARIRLTGRGPTDWPGVRAVAPTAQGADLDVEDAHVDAVLAAALAAGWSVTSVARP